MCLLTVDNKLMRKFGIGYKHVKKLEDGTYVCFDHLPHEGTVTYPLNQWITDPNDGDAEGSLPRYRTGFHISLDKGILEKDSFTSSRFASPEYPIIKVRFRKVTATNCAKPDIVYGQQVVAREIMNLGEVD